MVNILQGLIIPDDLRFCYMNLMLSLGTCFCLIPCDLMKLLIRVVTSPSGVGIQFVR